MNSSAQDGIYAHLLSIFQSLNPTYFSSQITHYNGVGRSYFGSKMCFFRALAAAPKDGGEGLFIAHLKKNSRYRLFCTDSESPGQLGVSG